MADIKTKLHISILFYQCVESDETLLPHTEQEIKELCKEVTDYCAAVTEIVCKPVPPFVKCLEMCISVAVSFMFLSP